MGVRLVRFHRRPGPADPARVLGRQPVLSRHPRRGEQRLRGLRRRQRHRRPGAPGEAPPSGSSPRSPRSWATRSTRPSALAELSEQCCDARPAATATTSPERRDHRGLPGASGPPELGRAGNRVNVGQDVNTLNIWRPYLAYTAPGRNSAAGNGRPVPSFPCAFAGSTKASPPAADLITSAEFIRDIVRCLQGRRPQRLCPIRRRRAPTGAWRSPALPGLD